MKASYIVLGAVLIVSTLSVAAEEASKTVETPKEPKPEEVNALIESLSATAFEKREEAQRRLEKLGEDVRTYLLVARENTKEPEVISRLDKLLKALNKPIPIVMNKDGTAVVNGQPLTVETLKKEALRRTGGKEQEIKKLEIDLQIPGDLPMVLVEKVVIICAKVGIEQVRYFELKEESKSAKPDESNNK